jgi:hypothetical protein
MGERTFAGHPPPEPSRLARHLASSSCSTPALGSGHFLVSAFHYLVPMRRATEKLSVRDAIDRVLADNLHGLELDARCVEIAAFALALAAWRYPDEKGQPHRLPSAAAPQHRLRRRRAAQQESRLAQARRGRRTARRRHGRALRLFQKAPELGSLIDPMAATRGDLLDAHWEELESLSWILAWLSKEGVLTMRKTRRPLAALEARVTARAWCTPRAS